MLLRSTARHAPSLPSADVLAAADDRSVLLITHRPEGLELVDSVVTVREPV